MGQSSVDSKRGLSNGERMTQNLASNPIKTHTASIDHHNLRENQQCQNHYDYHWNDSPRLHHRKIPKSSQDQFFIGDTREQLHTKLKRRASTFGAKNNGFSSYKFDPEIQTVDDNITRSSSFRSIINFCSQLFASIGNRRRLKRSFIKTILSMKKINMATIVKALVLITFGYMYIFYRIVTKHKENHDDTTNQPKHAYTYSYTDPYSHQIVRGYGEKATLNSSQNNKNPRQYFYASPNWDSHRYHHRNMFEKNERKGKLEHQEEFRNSPNLSQPPKVKIYPENVLDPMLRVSLGEETPEQFNMRKPYIEGDCVPMQHWQVDSKPSCNRLHEIDLVWERDFTYRMDDDSNDGIGEQEVKFLGQGWFRMAWEVKEKNVGTEENGEETYILKTLRFERDFHDEYFDLHRKDAMALEHLTSSPFVIDIYSFCGQSTVNEIAYDSVERVAMRIRDNDAANMYKLKIATQVAMGVADIHECDGPSENATSMVHYDINPRNIAVMNTGRVKINDFNVAEFVKWNKVKQEPCKFEGRLHEPWWRAPEEVIEPKEEEDPHILDEKIDVYSLCNVLYRIMTGRAPRGKSIPERMELIRSEVSNGIPPKLPAHYLDTEDEALIAIRNAMVHCYQAEAKDRWSAKDIANSLYDKLYHLTEKKQN